MTREEAQICFEYNLTVKINSKRCEWAKEDAAYQIRAVKSFYDCRLNQIEHSATLYNSGRAVYEVDVHNIDFDTGFEGFVHSKLRQKKNEQFRSLLSELVEQHKTKKAVNQIINKEIDKIRRENKGK